MLLSLLLLGSQGGCGLQGVPGRKPIIALRYSATQSGRKFRVQKRICIADYQYRILKSLSFAFSKVSLWKYAIFRERTHSHKSLFMVALFSTHTSPLSLV